MCAAPTATTPYKGGVGQALLRSELYLFFSRALLYPQEPLGEFWQRAVAAGQELRGEGASPLAALEPPPLEALQREYLTNFPHVPSQDYPVYEIAYGSSGLFQDSRQLSLIAGFYRAFGLEPKGGERLDHIGVELEFMYFMTYKEAHAQQQGEEEKAGVCHYAQRRFLEEHLGRWASAFFRRLRERGQGYYARLGEAALTFLSYDREHLEAQPKEIGEEALAPIEERGASWGCSNEAAL